MALGITNRQPAHKTITLSYQIKNLVVTLSMQFLYLHLLCYLNTMPEMKHSNSQLTDIPLMQNWRIHRLMAIQNTPQV